MGVSLFELMPGTEAQPRRRRRTRGSLGRLHAKLAVVDQRSLYIGSMNMDRRSAHRNTEMGLIVDSPELAGQVASLLQGERLPRSYQVRAAAPTSRACNGWRATAGAGRAGPSRMRAGAGSCACRCCRCSSSEELL